MPEAERLGRYDLVAPLRAGGMARVDVARLRGPYEFGRYVVIKRPLPHQATDAIALEQFRVEARLLASLHHPNVISFLDAGTDAAGVDFLALEYIHGTSLRDLAPPRGPVLARRPGLAATLTIARDIAAALHHVHVQTAVNGAPLGIVHRDVSPSNVLLGHDGSVKLIDFGVAKLTDGATVSGALRGKVSYMAPEQCKGEPIDRRADIYAVGVMLYELVTGHRPFYAADEVASLHKVIVGTVAPPAASDPGIDPALAEIIVRAMAYRPEDRYPTAAAMVSALEGFAKARKLELRGARITAELAVHGEIEPEPWRVVAAKLAASVGTDQDRAAAPAITSNHRKRRWPAIAIASVVVTAAGVAGYLGIASDPDPAPTIAVPSQPTGASPAPPRPSTNQATASPVAASPIGDAVPAAIPDDEVGPVEAATASLIDDESARGSERRRKRRGKAARPTVTPAPAIDPPKLERVSPVESPKEPPRRDAPKVWDPKAFDPVKPKASPGTSSK